MKGKIDSHKQNKELYPQCVPLRILLKSVDCCNISLYQYCGNGNEMNDKVEIGFRVIFRAKELCLPKVIISHRNHYNLVYFPAVC